MGSSLGFSVCSSVGVSVFLWLAMWLTDEETVAGGNSWVMATTDADCGGDKDRDDDEEVGTTDDDAEFG